MAVLGTLVYVVCGLTALLALYYAIRDLSADLVLLGACALALVVWAVLGGALLARDLGGAPVPDPVTLYGYVLTGLVLPLAAGWAGVWERSRWGSLVIAAAAVTEMVLMMRLPQIWAGGFA